MSKELIIEDGPITRLTINRPERHNAINTEVGDEMIDVVTRVGRDPTVQVLILGGTGKSFTSGDDITEGGLHPEIYPWENLLQPPRR